VLVYSKGSNIATITITSTDGLIIVLLTYV